MNTLECIALRGNSCMKSDSDRKKLIGLMTTMREVTCVLQVIKLSLGVTYNSGHRYGRDNR